MNTQLQVLEGFKAFDQDGNGVIERRELRSVLQALDAVTWTDDHVDNLMLSVDINGDGRIQFVEFLEWCFSDGGGADQQQMCQAASMASKEWRPVVRRPDVTSCAVDKPPKSLDDPALLQYIHSNLEEDVTEEEEPNDWCVEIVSLDPKNKKKALFTNGLSMEVWPDELDHLENLLRACPDGEIVVGHISRKEESPLPDYLIVNFEHEAPDYASPPPVDAQDVALDEYRAEEGGDGWFVKVVRLNKAAGQAVLVNGVTVAIRPQQAKLLGRLLSDVPEGSIVVGLLLAID